MRLCAFVCICVYLCAFVCVCVRLCAFACRFGRLRVVCVRLCAFVCVCVRLYAFVWLCWCTCVYVRVCVNARPPQAADEWIFFKVTFKDDMAAPGERVWVGVCVVVPLCGWWVGVEGWGLWFVVCGLWFAVCCWMLHAA